MPPKPRIRFIFLPIPGPENCFIIFCICSKDFKRRFTSSTFRPAPAAIRYFREEPMMLGFSLSLGVMDRMIASV